MTKKGNVKPVVSEQLIILRNAVAMAKYSLSLNQQKVFLEVAMMARKEPNAKFYKLYIKDFLKNIGVSTNDTADLKREIEEMRNITIHIPRTKKGGDLKANFFASVEIFENQQSRFIEIEISEKLKPYFIEIADGDFFHYQIQNTRVLKSNHSIRMYLYLKAWRWTGKAVIRYEELRDILGIKPTDYKLFGDFKRRVLNKAQQELGGKTDLAFEYTLLREQPNNPNTPVHRIAFKIHDNGRTPAIIEESKSPQFVIPLTLQPDTELLTIANQMGKMDEQELAALIGNYGRDRVYDVLLLANEEIERGNKIRSLNAYLHNAIKNNSGKGKAASKQEKQQQAALVKTHKEIETLLKSGLDDFKNDYFTKLGEQAPQSQKTAYFKLVEQQIIENPRFEQVYKVNGDWNTNLLKATLGAQLNQKSDDELAILYLQKIGKPAHKVNGFWMYTPS